MKPNKVESKNIDRLKEMKREQKAEDREKRLLVKLKKKNNGV